MNELLDALMANTHVTIVQLVNCNINNEGGKKIAELMTNNKAIVNLNLESNRIGPESMRLIAEGIEKNTTLVELKLTNQVSSIILYFDFKRDIITNNKILFLFFFCFLCGF